MRLMLCICVWMMACRADQQLSGTSIGNPNRTMLSMAPTAGLPVEDVSVDEARVSMWSCDGEWVELAFSGESWLGTVVSVPEGTWCWMSLTWEPPLVVVAFDESAEREVFVELDLDRLDLQIAPADALEGDHVLELASPDWGLDILEEDTDDPLFIDEEHPLYERLVVSVQQDSTLWRDEDGDGELSDVERDTPAVGVASDELPQVDEEDTDDEQDEEPPDARFGCACAGVGARGGMLWPLFWLGALLLRRRGRSRGT